MSTCATTSRLTTRRSSRSPFGSPVLVSRLRWLLTATLLAVATGVVSTASPATAAPEPSPSPPCEAGSFCTWQQEQHRGAAASTDLRSTNLGECVALPEFDVRSFVNATGRPVSVYQDAGCSSEADFSTFPTGSSVDRAPFAVRAITIWSH